MTDHMNTPMIRAALIEQLAAWLLNRDERIDLSSDFGHSTVKSGGSQEHSGDCTKGPWACMRCVAEEAVEDAKQLLCAIEAAGIALVPAEPTVAMLVNAAPINIDPSARQMILAKMAVDSLPLLWMSRENVKIVAQIAVDYQMMLAASPFNLKEKA
jgi:hypothetical protein